MSDQFVGEIRMFGGNFAPVGWLLCDGSQLQISQYQVLFSLLGTVYGGNGSTTFNLPDYRGRLPIGIGQGTGLTNRLLGQTGGSETVSLTAAQLPAHNHMFAVTKTPAANTPTISAGVARGTPDTPAYAAFLKDSATSPVVTTLDPSAVSNAGGNQAHPNIMPSLVVNFIIAYEGIYPSQA